MPDADPIAVHAPRPGALIFDVFGTCVDWRRSVARVVAEMLGDRAPGLDPLFFADAWRAEYQPAMEGIRSGARGYVSLDDLHLENLNRVLARFELGDVLSEAEVTALNAAWEQLDPWPDVVPGLEALKRHAIVAPCSNGSIAMMTRLARHGGLPWDCILGADIARAYKPDPLAYRLSVAALRLDPGEVMMVAAHNDDLRAARAEGLRTAFVPRPGEHGPGQESDLAPQGDWDVVAADFGALAASLFGPVSG